MDQINSKEDLISYFKKGCKAENCLNIGVENEKFIFENKTNKRAFYLSKNRSEEKKLLIKTW